MKLCYICLQLVIFQLSVHADHQLSKPVHIHLPYFLNVCIIEKEDLRRQCLLLRTRPVLIFLRCRNEHWKCFNYLWLLGCVFLMPQQAEIGIGDPKTCSGYIREIPKAVGWRIRFMEDGLQTRKGKGYKDRISLMKEREEKCSQQENLKTSAKGKRSTKGECCPEAQQERKTSRRTEWQIACLREARQGLKRLHWI